MPYEQINYFRFSPMDGFFLAVFLAVCILVAVVLRCLCYRCCMQSCSEKFRRSNEEDILPRHSAATITPAGCNSRRCQTQPRRQQQQDRSPQMMPNSRPVIPQAGTVFTIYTFPQQDASPELSRPSRGIEVSKYSTIPTDSPPKYEDLFPSSPKEMSTSIELEVISEQPFLEDEEPPARDVAIDQAHPSSASFSSTSQALTSSVPTNATVVSNANPSLGTSQSQTSVPREAPPLYDVIYPQK
ncbi:uncharacterized protein LOC135223603 isoform X1 [Macrobrachium nipponense]|uniref:uncharacterized protein LOC135223603 isoform X1 n=1 Tax=Macrobrachium nipponense TaxID=159736 RepID=UPI0030C7A761